MNLASTTESEGVGEEYSLEELVQRTGVSARNIRFYTNRAILPPPGKKGRTAVYSPQHRALLELVRELQSHGFTLAAITNYIDRIPNGSSTETIRLHGTLLAPWLSDRPETLSFGELSDRAGRELTGDEIEVLETLGLVETVDGAHVNVTASLLPLGVEMLNAGLPLVAAQRARKVLDQHALSLAEELTEIFRDTVWPAYKKAGTPSSAVQDAINSFKPLTIHGFISAYERAVNSTKRATIQRRIDKSGR
ncbi:MerR family transcriptional regulator [Dietzia timorensis]|uniref:HTH merR-type domain-containing protein n=1 Tax=Dietzia timorensis TaxID=499555 RepID=A0A173LGA7_9ACTN|nr:MerR family transcriptional regulator [Dietzia timorensis]ANI91265.1 Hypothetical protein BJL86_0458 [Dietzia timorensis]